MESDTEVRPRKKLRSFTAETKARLLAEYDAATTPLERAALKRREDVYSSLISNWRKQGSTPPAKRGRPANTEAAESARLRKENQRLERKLAKAEHTLAAVKKAHALLQMIAGESTADEERSKLDMAHSERFADASERQIYGTLLDEGCYRASISTW